MVPPGRLNGFTWLLLGLVSLPHVWIWDSEIATHICLLKCVTSHLRGFEGVTWRRSLSEAQRCQGFLQLSDLRPQPLAFIWQRGHIHHRQSGLNTRTTVREMKTGVGSRVPFSLMTDLLRPPSSVGAERLEGHAFLWDRPEI